MDGDIQGNEEATLPLLQQIIPFLPLDVEEMKWGEGREFYGRLAQDEKCLAFLSMILANYELSQLRETVSEKEVQKVAVSR